MQKYISGGKGRLIRQWHGLESKTSKKEANATDCEKPKTDIEKGGLNMDEYVLTQTIKTKNVTANVYQPILTQEERERRYRNIYKAAEHLLKSRSAK